MDHNVRPYLNDKQVDFIGTPAQTIMRHLEAMVEAKEKDKIKRLASGMNAFVEGKAHSVVEVCEDALESFVKCLTRYRHRSITST